MALSSQKYIAMLHGKYNYKTENFDKDTVKIEILAEINNDNSFPTFSKDKKSVAYISQETGAPELWVVTVEDKQNVCLTANKFDKAMPVWDYGSKYIYFMQKENKRWSIVRVNVASKITEKILTGEKNIDYLDPEILPGDSLIMYCIRGGFNEELVDDWKETDMNISKIRNVNIREQVTSGENNRNPRISPSGIKILFEQSAHTVADKTGITEYNIQEHTTIPRTERDMFWGGAWTPDEKYIIGLYGINEAIFNRLGHIGEELNAGPCGVVILPSNITNGKKKEEIKLFVINMPNNDSIHYYIDKSYPKAFEFK